MSDDTKAGLADTPAAAWEAWLDSTVGEMMLARLGAKTAARLGAELRVAFEAGWVVGRASARPFDIGEIRNPRTSQVLRNPQER